MILNKDTYRVGIYTRLSIDDRTNEESVSIDTQKKILTEFVANKGWQIAKIYVDDGYSGGNFERPDFKRMIQDIENKEIDCVVTKDLSRLGRNYLDCGYYLEIYFPEHQVRYIAVNDGVDTISNSSMDITPFKNILNEMYVKDISTKVSSARNARLKSGKYMTTTAPYGYIKDPNNHNHLLIDEETAPIVKKIYELYAQGKGTHYIANYLENNKILRPSEYLLRKGIVNKFQRTNKNEYYWSNKTILDIISNPVYYGAVVGNKTKKVSPKSKKIIKLPPEQWTIVENMHEPIISKELFESVQRIRTKNKIQYAQKMNEERYDNIFGKIARCPFGKCLECKKIDHRQSDVDIENRKYCCKWNCEHKTKECVKGVYIRANELYNIVLADISTYSNDIYNDKSNYSILEQQIIAMTDQNTKMYEAEKNKLENRLKELNQLITSSYEDKVFKKITEETFILVSNKYEQEKLDIRNKLNVVIENLEQLKRESNNVNSFKNRLKEFKGAKELTAVILSNIIDDILIYPSVVSKNEDGKQVRMQTIEIVYRYVGSLGETTINVPTTYKTRYRDRKCELCGKTYTPITSTQIFCNKCKDEGNKINRRKNYYKRIEAKGGHQGFKERTCQMCGKSYKPNSSVQQFCDDCKIKAKKERQHQWYLKKKICQEKIQRTKSKQSA